MENITTPVTTTPGISNPFIAPFSQGLELSETQKMTIAGMAALLFFILNHPLVYQLVESISAKIVDSGQIALPAGCPTTVGVVVHSLVFLLLCRGLLQLPFKNLSDSKQSDFELPEDYKWSISISYTLIFLIIAQPITFSLVNRVFNVASASFQPIIASSTGCPTLLGLFVHTLVFFGLARAVVQIGN